MIAIQTIKVNNKKREAIIIHRGDCGMLDFTFESGDEEYVMDATDTLELTVRKLPNSESPVLLHAVSAPGVAQIVLHTEDTKLEAGDHYPRLEPERRIRERLHQKSARRIHRELSRAQH